MIDVFRCPPKNNQTVLLLKTSAEMENLSIFRWLIERAEEYQLSRVTRGLITICMVSTLATERLIELLAKSFYLVSPTVLGTNGPVTLHEDVSETVREVIVSKSTNHFVFDSLMDSLTEGFFPNPLKSSDFTTQLMKLMIEESEDDFSDQIHYLIQSISALSSHTEKKIYAFIKQSIHSEDLPTAKKIRLRSCLNEWIQFHMDIFNTMTSEGQYQKEALLVSIHNFQKHMKAIRTLLNLEADNQRIIDFMSTHTGLHQLLQQEILEILPGRVLNKELKLLIGVFFVYCQFSLHSFLRMAQSNKNFEMVEFILDIWKRENYPETAFIESVLKGAINSTQQCLLDSYLEMAFSPLEEQGSVVAMHAFKALKADELSLASQQFLESKDLLDSIEIIKAVSSHPHPQCRSTSYPYFESPSDNNLVVYKNENNKPAFEPRGLLSLSAKNDSTAMAVTKEAVVARIVYAVDEKLRFHAATVIKHSFWQKKRRSVEQLFTHVVDGEQEQARRFLSIRPELLLEYGSVKDTSERYFPNITAFQYSMWALDVRYMSTMMLDCLPKNERGDAIRRELLRQYEQLKTNGVEYTLNNVSYREKQFNFTPLLNALKNYIHSKHKRHLLWVAIGIPQRDLPAHVRHHYCDPNYPFSARSDFCHDKLSRTLVIFVGSENKMREWKADFRELGVHFAIVRGRIGAPQATTNNSFRHDSNYPKGDVGLIRARDDLETIIQLVRTRQNDLVLLEQRLNQSVLECIAEVIPARMFSSSR